MLCSSRVLVNKSSVEDGGGELPLVFINVCCCADRTEHLNASRGPNAGLYRISCLDLEDKPLEFVAWG